MNAIFDFIRHHWLSLILLIGIGLAIWSVVRDGTSFWTKSK